MKITVTITAYRSYRDRESNINPVESKVVSTPEEFDSIEGDYYSRGFFLAYFSTSGARLRREGARFILVTEFDKERRRSAVYAVTGWLEKNREYTTRELMDIHPEVVRRGDDYYVTLEIRGPRGYEYFTFRVNLANRSVELIGEYK